MVNRAPLRRWPRVVGIAIITIASVSIFTPTRADEPPVTRSEIEVEAKAPLVRDDQGTRAIIDLCLTIVEEECPEEDDAPRPPTRDPIALRCRHIRSLVAASRARKGTTAALTGKLVLAQLLEIYEPLSTESSAIYRAIEIDCPGTWQSVIARLCEARIIASSRNGERHENERRALAIAQHALREIPDNLTQADINTMEAMRQDLPLRADCLHAIAHFQYNASEPTAEIPRYDQELLKKARATTVQLLAEYPDLPNKRSDEDLISTIDTILERETARK